MWLMLIKHLAGLGLEQEASQNNDIIICNVSPYGRPFILHLNDAKDIPCSDEPHHEGLILQLNHNEFPVIFTDLDGTLLDHDDYSYHAVESLLVELHTKSINVIPTTSKTASEVLQLRADIGFNTPFIIENGAAIFIPQHAFSTQPEDTQLVSILDSNDQLCHFWRKAFCEPRSHWLKVIEKLQGQYGDLYQGFSQLTALQVSQLTGLKLEEATKAKQRDFSEPLHWLGTDQQKQLFIEHLNQLGVKVLQGGRFVHLSGNCDKGQAMQWLLNLYQQNSFLPLNKTKYISIALGDSHNDIAMLEQADYAIRIASPHHDLPPLQRTQQMISSQQYGPKGWNETIRMILKDYFS